MTVSLGDTLYSKALCASTSADTQAGIPKDFSKEMKRKLKGVLFEEEIQNQILFKEGPTTHTSSASSFSWFHPKVVVKKLPDEEETLFSIKRQLGLIHYHEALLLPIFTILPMMIGTLFIPSSNTSGWDVTNLILTCMIGFFSYVITKSIVERKADDFAIKHSSNLQLIEGGTNYLIRLQKQNQSKKVSFEIASEMARNFFNKLNWGIQGRLYTKSGECRLNLIGPSIESRIEKISLELLRRKTKVD